MEEFVRKQLLGASLYMRCVTEGGKIHMDELQSRLHTLQAHGRYSDCSEEEFAQMCGLHKQSSDSCFSMMKAIQLYYLGDDFYARASKSPCSYEEIQTHFQHEVQDKRQLLMSFSTRRFIDYLFDPFEDQYVLRSPTSKKTMLYFSANFISDNAFLSKDELALAFSFKDKKVALAQGNFGPPHKGHYQLVRQGVKDLKPDVLIIHAMNDENVEKSRHGILDNHGSFVVWQSFAELLFREFPHLTIMYSCQLCHDEYLGIMGEGMRVDCPAHFRTWSEKASYYWIRSIEVVTDQGRTMKARTQELWEKADAYYKEHAMPLIHRQQQLLLATERETEQNEESVILPFYLYPRQEDNLSATRFSKAIQSKGSLDDYLPDGLTASEKARVLRAVRFVDPSVQEDLLIIKKFDNTQLQFPKQLTVKDLSSKPIEELVKYMEEVLRRKNIDMWVLDGILSKFSVQYFTSQNLKKYLRWMTMGFYRTHEIEDKTWQSISTLFDLWKRLSRGRDNFLTRWIMQLPESIKSQAEYDEFAQRVKNQMLDNQQRMLRAGFHTYCDSENRASEILSEDSKYSHFFMLSEYIEL